MHKVINFESVALNVMEDRAAKGLGCMWSGHETRMHVVWE